MNGFDNWRDGTAERLTDLFMAALERAEPEITTARERGDHGEAVALTERALSRALPAVLAEFDARLREAREAGWMAPHLKH